MKDRQLLFTLLVAGMSLGTAWAIRGQFGHEQGAAWAGGIGGLSIVLLAKRPDWYAKAFHLALASAAGWGIGGIISYGIVVGYGRGIEFGNVYYGLLMLFVIGGLFGLIGGGLFGLVLASTKDKPVAWHQLILEMTAGALIFYYLLIEELGWLMTPPRSEAWAACFGMTVAMFWFMIRNRQYAAIRVAVFAGLGGGFGFAFGNFLQVMGNVSGIKFNFWNVMEYSIGFFGGIGMAYGTFTSKWEQQEAGVPKNSILVPLVILTLIIPFIVWDQSFGTERILNTVQEISPTGDGTGITRYVQWIALLLIAGYACYFIYVNYQKRKGGVLSFSFDSVRLFFLANLSVYTIYSILITCAFMSTYRIEQYLYVVNVVIIGLLVGKFEPSFTDRGLNINRWFINLIFVLAIIALLTAVAVSSHGELKGAQSRF
ncbi:photosystem II biosynthesis protein [Dyadobacter bucti]|uniref:photosystem II biosynthesis protein n=1 Tax=Dyadobacter bucti TaxID=2572203 RepID=UPI001109A17D|nr:photosystem II biosynthesis protein [Dyadobacter bucti]